MAAALYSIENEEWMSIRKAADAVMHQTIAAGLTRHGIAFRVTESGVEIAAYSRAHILKFSDGLKSVNRALENAGFDLSKSHGRASEVANLTTRLHKRISELDSIKEMWVERARVYGVPIFEPGDKRLEMQAGENSVRAMTAMQAVDAGIERAQGAGKRLHSDFALLRIAIRASGYRTAHAEIMGEVTRRLECGELIHTQQGILRKPEALKVATEVQRQAAAMMFAELRTPEAIQALRGQLSPGHSLSSPNLTDTQWLSVVNAVSGGSDRKAVELYSTQSAKAMSHVLSRFAAAHGLTPILVSDDVQTDQINKSSTFASALALTSKLTPLNVLILTTTKSTSPAAISIIRKACERSGAMAIELTANSSKQRIRQASVQSTQAQNTEPLRNTKLNSLKLASKLRLPAHEALVTHMRGEARQIETQAPKLRQ